ncbi:MAG: trypsin-like peptidase domain-containing protein [Pseudomonadota bacterium]
MKRFAFRCFLLGLISLALALCGCTVSPSTPRKSEKPLVSQEHPIFDKRFQNLSFKDLDLRNLWVEGGDHQDKNVPVHNNTFAEIAEAAKDGVVNIYTRKLEEREAKFGLSPNDILPFRILLVSDIFDIIPFKVPVPYQTEGFSLGSGFIINQHGFILTNAHVIQDATDINVVFSEGKKKYPAKIIGADLLTDTALLKIEPNSLLKALPLGNSNTLKTGEMVLAMGNPLGLMHSLSSGIISAKERVFPELNERLVDFVQTDSAINPGSSGGPLLNLYGEVVGINTALVSEAQSIGFAIPINTVKEVMPMLVLGQTQRGWFGAKAVPVTTEEASKLNYSGEGGVLVLEVEKDSPAEKAGLQPKDIIIELNGEPLKSFVLFRRKLLGLAPGNSIDLSIYRDGATVKASGVLEKKSPGEKAIKKGE